VTLITVEVVMSHKVTQLKPAAKPRVFQHADLNRCVEQDFRRQLNADWRFKLAGALHDEDVSVW
jgi:hypothetical protein